ALDLRRDARLLHEPIDEPRLPREVGVQHLDSHARPEKLVRRFVDGSHPAVAEQANETVLSADDLADGDHGRAESRAPITATGPVNVGRRGRSAYSGGSAASPA